MHVSDGFTGAIGNTPLIRLRGVSDETGCESPQTATQIAPAFQFIRQVYTWTHGGRVT